MGSSQVPLDATPSRCAIGLDVGGTKTAGGLVTADGAIVLRQTIPTHAHRGGEAVADDAYRLVENLLSQAAEQSMAPSAIGISICEIVSEDGQIVSDQTVRWSHLGVQRRFSQLAPTVIEADSRAAALCEARYGAGRSWPSFLYVTIGTGIGCSFVIGGLPYRGANGITGTIASGVTTTTCSACGQLSASVLEGIASGPALVTRYGEITERAFHGAEEVLAAAEHGDSAARDVVLAATESLGSAIGLLVGVLDPHGVVIGGGLGSAAGLYWQMLQAATRRHIWSDKHRGLPIVQGEYGGLAGLVGAAAAALEKQSI